MTTLDPYECFHMHELFGDFYYILSSISPSNMQGWNFTSFINAFAD